MTTRADLEAAATAAEPNSIQPRGNPEDSGLIRGHAGGGWLRPFKPGQSGNPGGAVGFYHEARRVCAAASPAAIARQIQLMDSDDERVALMATEAILSRGIGKPRDHSAEDQRDQRADISMLSADERRTLARLLSIVFGVTKPQ